MSATERLHRLLTEYGIEHESVGGITTWVHSDCYVAEYDELLDGSDTRLIVFRATPEQAIAATVGERTTTRNGKYVRRHYRDVPLCECCGQAIGDERYNYCPKCGARIVE